MGVFRPNSPLSLRQRRVNKAVLLVSVLLGVAFGVVQARECAAISSAYLGDYNYAISFSISTSLTILGLLLLVHWRTRWFGAGFIAVGVLSYVTFLSGMAVLTKEDRVAWRHEQMISFGPDQKASAVIYFRKAITSEQVEDFNSSVLMGPAMPRHAGRDYPPFVQSYFRLAPIQANGHEGIALTFFANAPTEKVNAYLSVIKEDMRVESMFLNVAPNSVHPNSSHP